MWLSWLLWLLLKQEEWVLENYPNDIAHGFRSIFLASLGRHKEALSSAYLSLDLAQYDPGIWGAMAWCLAVCGETEEAQQLAKEAYAARLPRCPRPWIAPALVALGEPDQAFTLLREAREEKCPWFPGSRLDPRLAVLQEDERWHIFTFKRLHQLFIKFLFFSCNILKCSTLLRGFTTIRG